MAHPNIAPPRSDPARARQVHLFYIPGRTGRCIVGDRIPKGPFYRWRVIGTRDYPEYQAVYVQP